MVCIPWYACFDMHRHISTNNWEHLNTQLTSRHRWACHDTCECHGVSMCCDIWYNNMLFVLWPWHTNCSVHACLYKLRVKTFMCTPWHVLSCHNTCVHVAVCFRHVSTSVLSRHLRVVIYMSKYVCSVCLDICMSWYAYLHIHQDPRAYCNRYVHSSMSQRVYWNTGTKSQYVGVCAHHIRIFIHLTRSDGIRLMGFDRKCGLSPLPFVSYPGSSWRTWQIRSRINNIW